MLVVFSLLVWQLTLATVGAFDPPHPCVHYPIQVSRLNECSTASDFCTSYLNGPGSFTRTTTSTSTATIASTVVVTSTEEISLEQRAAAPTHNRAASCNIGPSAAPSAISGACNCHLARSATTVITATESTTTTTTTTYTASDAAPALCTGFQLFSTSPGTTGNAINVGAQSSALAIDTDPLAAVTLVLNADGTVQAFDQTDYPGILVGFGDITPVFPAGSGGVEYGEAPLICTVGTADRQFTCTSTNNKNAFFYCPASMGSSIVFSSAFIIGSSVQVASGDCSPLDLVATPIVGACS